MRKPDEVSSLRKISSEASGEYYSPECQSPANEKEGLAAGSRLRIPAGNISPGKFRSEPETLDLSSLIPPPNPLPAITLAAEDTKLPSHYQNKNPVQTTGTSNTRMVIVSSFHKSKAMTPASGSHLSAHHRVLSISSNKEAAGKDEEEEEEKAGQIIEEAFEKDVIGGYYSLEFKELKGVDNPVVYSRNGKAAYDSSARSEGGVSFGMKDLQAQLAGKQKWRWRFAAGDKVPPYYVPADESDKTLVFESRFESGNLGLAIKVSDEEYKLVLQNDSLTKGNTQWFYFKVSNTRKSHRVHFSILNFRKRDSLYNYGMKVALFSEKRHQYDGTLWTRGGESIRYEKLPLPEDCGGASFSDQIKAYYSLSFEYTFDFDSDTVSFAFSEPYTYSELQKDLDGLKASRKMTRETLCKTISGGKCDLLTITSSRPSSTDEIKQGIVLTARVHPGETVGSWMMKGAIDFLLSEDKEAEALREACVFKIVPMLNPDGVIQGNYRCSLSGYDLNRRYTCPSKTLHAEVFYTKKMVRRFAKEVPMLFYCDFHGHSKSKNVFMYGNNDEASPEEYRLFPYVMAKVCSFFSYKSSRFAVQKSKASTARIAMWKELAIPGVYTIEASFLGPSSGEAGVGRGEEEEHFTAEQLMGIGRNMCQALGIYLKMKTLPLGAEPSRPLNVSSTLCRQQPKGDGRKLFGTRKKADALAKNILAEIKEHRELLLTQQNNQDDGSDSSPSDDNVDPKELIEATPDSGFNSANFEGIEVRVGPKKKCSIDNSGEGTPARKKLSESKTPAAKDQHSRFIRPGKKRSKTRSMIAQYVEMVDRWTQTSPREEAKEQGGAASQVPIPILRNVRHKVSASGNSLPHTRFNYTTAKEPMRAPGGMEWIRVARDAKKHLAIIGNNTTPIQYMMTDQSRKQKYNRSPPVLNRSTDSAEPLQKKIASSIGATLVKEARRESEQPPYSAYTDLAASVAGGISAGHHHYHSSGREKMGTVNSSLMKGRPISGMSLSTTERKSSLFAYPSMMGKKQQCASSFTTDD